MPIQFVSQAHYCCLADEHDPPPVLAAGGDAERMEALRLRANKWDNGLTLTYAFFDNDDPGTGGGAWTGRPEDLDVVRRAFKTWKKLGIGLSFREVNDPAAALIRIGFAQGDGSWSFVGTGCLTRPINTRTMNFGWSLLQNGGFDTALHEIGHAIGMPHEHQNPNAGIVWDEDAVYVSLAGPPNGWSHEKTHANILRKLAAKDIEGSAWDPDSIMHYPFEAGLIIAPDMYKNGLRPAGGLSPLDIAWVRKFYPPSLSATKKLLLGKAAALAQKVGEQVGFEFVPSETRPYRLRTSGPADRQLSLVEELPSGDETLLKSDDDSGEDRNASLNMELIRGRHYKILVSTRYMARDAAHHENALLIE